MSKKYVTVSVDFLDDLHYYIACGEDWVAAAQILDEAMNLPAANPTEEDKAKADELVDFFKDLQIKPLKIKPS